MKKTFFLTLLAFSGIIYAQIPAYYSSINFSLTGMALKNQLATLITNTHTPITYTDVWDVLIVSDLDPTNSSKVLLVYGYNDADGNVFNDRTRDKYNSGGSSGQWNREHTFAKSLGNPDLGTSGPGSDAHNLRASDVDMNANRGNMLYADGSGNAGAVGSNWYPGDEWKGDCARIIMYMYLRYGLQCRPYFCTSGTANTTDANMVNLLLDWNVEDPVSQLEKNRNNTIQTWQGNRNPFIDNPYIATRIWGGTPAEDTWGGLSTEDYDPQELSIYPIPATNHEVYISCSEPLEVDYIRIYTETGQLIRTYWTSDFSGFPLHVEEIPSGIWILQLQSGDQLSAQKIVVL